jgi:hypothetical protein
MRMEEPYPQAIKPKQLLLEAYPKSLEPLTKKNIKLYICKVNKKDQQPKREKPILDNDVVI